MLKNEPSQPDGQRGVIINVSSVTMSNGPPGTTVYAASKAALAAITMPLAKELGPSGIRVVDIAPGKKGRQIARNGKLTPSCIKIVQFSRVSYLSDLVQTIFCFVAESFFSV